MKTYTKKLLHRARTMRKAMTAAEHHLWLTRLRQAPYKFRRQRPFGIYIADFYCAKLKLVIEVDGAAHFDAAAKIYDDARTEFLRSLGLRVIRFTNDDVLHRMEEVDEVLTRLFEIE